jgi:hypothetical protein
MRHDQVRFSPEWSSWVMIVAILLLLAGFVLYFYAR